MEGSPVRTHRSNNVCPGGWPPPRFPMMPGRTGAIPWKAFWAFQPVLCFKLFWRSIPPSCTVVATGRGGLIRAGGGPPRPP